jgi:hypothetical protein
MTDSSPRFDEAEFRRFLKRNQRADSVLRSSLQSVQALENFLKGNGKNLDNAAEDDLEAFAAECGDDRTIKNSMHALRYYYEFMKNRPMAKKTDEIRARFLKRTTFKLKDFVGVKPTVIGKLAERGIRDTEQMLRAGRTESDRRNLSKNTGVPVESVLELVKMSDLARIFGLKGVRARLYHDAGVDTVEKMSRTNPDELIRITTEFVERTGFEGIPPAPKEAQFTVKAAKNLPRLVEY